MLPIARISAAPLLRREEIAAAISYLLSPAAASTIGAALVVDGGYSIR